MKKLTGILSLAVALCLSLTGCMVEQTMEGTSDVDITEEPRIIATSLATMQILDALNLPIIARVETAGEIPDYYADKPIVGTAMAPDGEAIAMLDANAIIGPDTLIDSIKPTYDAVGIEGIFIDLQSVEGLYESVAMLGEQFDRQQEAQQLLEDYEVSLAEFMTQVEGAEAPRVLVLMGLPGAYIGCTTNSYVGSLVELAGAVNVIQVDTEENFVSWNTEALLALDPDIILLTAHAMPELAMTMFATEFATNDIWKNFRAVEEGQVYGLKYENFGMSATFGWKTGFSDLMEIFYGEGYGSFVA